MQIMRRKQNRNGNRHPNRIRQTSQMRAMQRHRKRTIMNFGLCAICILNLNAAATPYFGTENTGLAKELENTIITLPSGLRLEFTPGQNIPPGAPYLSDLFTMFGETIDIRQPGTHQRIYPFAVTMNKGYLVCDEHNGQLHTGQRKLSSP